MDHIANKMFSKTTIKGYEFQISKLGGLEGMKMSLKITKVLAPLLGGIIDGARAADDFDTPETFKDLALTLCDQIDDLDIENIITRLLRGSTKNNIEIRDLNVDFIGEIDVFVELVAFALKENFYKVFMENPLLARLKTKVEGMMEDS